MFKFGSDDTKIGNVGVKGNIGVRYVTTDVSSTGGAQFPRFVAPNPATARRRSIRRVCSRRRPIVDVHELRLATPTCAGADHAHWLPSLNLRFGLTDEQFVRFAVSRALARPDMGLYKFYYNITEVGTELRRGQRHVRGSRRLHVAHRLPTPRVTRRAWAIRA